jgi:hypothetical protein
MPKGTTFESCIVDINPELREEPLVASFRKRLRTIGIDGETLFVAEGDLLLDVDQLILYADEKKSLNEIKKIKDKRVRRGMGDLSIVEPFRAQLVGITQGDKIVRWGPGVQLSYCVLRNTFSNDTEYQMVRKNMTEATHNWEETCGVRFEHRQDLDTSPTTTPSGILFTVRGIDAGGRFIAAAFFPGDPVSRRRMLIDPSYFTTSFNKVGVLRHELGHVLGFRHEHIRSEAPAACPGESLEETINLGDYDPQSVMHYFCGGVGNPDLAITDIDKEGARKVYGLPLDKYLFIAVDTLPEGRAGLSDLRIAGEGDQLRERSTEELLEELDRRVLR